MVSSKDYTDLIYDSSQQSRNPPKPSASSFNILVEFVRQPPLYVLSNLSAFNLNRSGIANVIMLFPAIPQCSLRW